MTGQGFKNFPKILVISNVKTGNLKTVEIIVLCSKLPSIGGLLRIYNYSPLSPFPYGYSDVHIDPYSAHSLVPTSMENSTSV
jgi:hypothetical protein